MRRALYLLFALVTVACGGSSPAAPSGPQFPSVGGSYSGTLTLTYPELGQSMTCSATTSVTQSGANVSMAPLILGGNCTGLSLPIGSFTIDQNGAMPSSNQTFFEPSCGGNYTAALSGGFFGRQFQASMTLVSSTCWNINATAVLTR